MADEELVWGEWFRWHWLRYTYLVAAALFDVLVAAEIRFLGPHPPPPWVLALAAARGGRPTLIRGASVGGPC